jgi:phosphoglycerate dehydrogenase-like enzyme
VRRAADPVAGIVGMDDWRALLPGQDYVILAAPETPATRHMIGRNEFAAMKAGARFVNVARGTMVDQEALIAALASGALAGAVLDVTDPEPLPPDHPLWSAPNLLVTMHMSGRGNPATWARACERFAANVRRYLAGEPLEARVDLARGY